MVPRPLGTTPPVSYAELVAILLTGITVVLAILAIVVAGLAIWGYQSIKIEAAKAAESAVVKAVEDVVAKHLNNPAIQGRIKRGLEKILREHEDMLYASAFNAKSGPQGHVAEKYPGEKP